MIKPLGMILGAVAVSLCLMLSASAADRDVIEFRADTYRKSADGAELHGKIFVGRAGVRTEIKTSQGESVRIFEISEKKSHLLDPASRTYRSENTAGIGLMGLPANRSDNPCQGLTHSKCVRGELVTISGREAWEWDIIVTQGESKLLLKQWIDRQRGMVLRHLTESGDYSEMRLLEYQVLEGREVEKWLMTIAQGEADPVVFYNWYDPELNMFIREQHPDGTIRAIRNIVTGTQGRHLFRVPAGYRQVK